MSKNACCPQKTIDSSIESPFGASIMPGTDLCVNCTQIEEGASLLERDGTLARGYTGQRVVPLEIDAQIAIGWKEASFHIVQ